MVDYHRPGLPYWPKWFIFAAARRMEWIGAVVHKGCEAWCLRPSYTTGRRKWPHSPSQARWTWGNIFAGLLLKPHGPISQASSPLHWELGTGVQLGEILGHILGASEPPTLSKTCQRNGCLARSSGSVSFRGLGKYFYVSGWMHFSARGVDLLERRGYLIWSLINHVWISACYCEGEAPPIC